MTYGEKIIRTDFNASNDSEVQRVKNLFAKLIDEVSSIHEKKFEELHSITVTSEEESRLKQQQDEKYYDMVQPLFIKVIDKLEDVAIYYVKLLTA